MNSKKVAGIAMLMLLVAIATALLQPLLTGLVVDNTTHTVMVRLFVIGNRPPTLDAIGNQTAKEGFAFTLQVTASDPDGNTLAFSENTSLFDINSSTGFINFTPALSQVGNHTVKVTASDGNLSDSEAFNIEIKLGLFCGDDVCSGTESCSSCSSDCGSCSGGGGGAGAGGGAGSGSGGAEGAGAGAGGGGAGGGGGAAFAFCDENWQCTEWDACSNGIQTRNCTDGNKCRTVLNKPNEQRACIAEKKQEEITAPDHCSDSVWNYDEQDVDCGGSCAPCIIKRFAAIPIPQIPLTEIARQFPWIIPIVMGILAGVMAAADRTYTFYVRKLHFERYRKKEANYRPWRRRLYTGIVSMFALAIVYSLYIYHYSLNFASMARNIWIMGIASVAVPAAVYVVLRKTEYSEFRHTVARQRLHRIHQRQMWQLARIENETLLKIEESASEALSVIAKFEEYSPLLELKETARQLFDLHARQVASTVLPEETRKLLAAAAQLPQIYHAYPELERLGQDARKIAAVVEGDESSLIEAAGNLLDSVRGIARDNLLLSVVMSDKTAVAYYNRIVDLYQYFDGLEKGRLESEGAVATLEAQFVQQFEALDADFASGHSQSSDFVKAYNKIVELYNHCKKKAQSE